MDHTLTTVELLELILLELDLQTLLTSASRVCHYWNQIIRDSSELQARLFFRPERQKPGLRAHLTEPCTNPWLRQNMDIFTHIFSQYLATPKVEACYLYPEASWRKMLVQQPPARSLGIWTLEMGTFLPEGFKNKTETMEFQDGRGLRLHNLVKLAHARPGYTWSIFSGEDGEKSFACEKSGLFVQKAGSSERDSISRMGESDVVIKMARWTVCMGD